MCTNNFWAAKQTVYREKFCIGKKRCTGFRKEFPESGAREGMGLDQLAAGGLPFLSGRGPRLPGLPLR